MPQEPTRRQPLRAVTLSQCPTPHAGLWLDKFIVGQSREQKETRRNLVREVADLPVPSSYHQFYQRWAQTLSDCYQPPRYAVKSGFARVLGRVVIGTGNESVLETAITLHRTYGVPYLPGSALKGVAAAFARHYCGAAWTADSDNYQIVFGDTTAAGCVTFFDALPEPSSKLLHTDVLTPHHSDYYMKHNIAPADWDAPTPVPFLSATGRYRLFLATSASGEEWLEAVFEILRQALAELGLGAKTSSGYGRMELT